MSDSEPAGTVSDSEPADAALKLTAYFPERERAGSRFLAESMLELFARRRVATSVLLRGISGFGRRHVINTDQSLTLSEDPSVTVVAVDRADTIRALAGEIAEMTPAGLITLERARWLDDLGTVPAADSVKLTVYVGRNRRADGMPAYKAVCRLLHRHRFAGASVFLGVDGTAHGERRRAHFVARNVDVPVMIIAVGSAEQVHRCAPELTTLLQRPLATLERVRLCRRDGLQLAAPPALPAADDAGRPLWQKLMVVTSETDRHDGMPIHRALVRRLWQSGAAPGATVLRGVWGFHDDREPHGDKLFQLGRRVPAMTVIVGRPGEIAHAHRVVDELTGEHGLVTCETVPAVLRPGPQSGARDLADFRY